MNIVFTLIFKRLIKISNDSCTPNRRETSGLLDYTLYMLLYIIILFYR